MGHRATRPAGGGLGADWTAAVAAEVPVVLPALFVPVTATRSVAPAATAIV